MLGRHVKVAVTGASGFIGGHLWRTLAASGSDVLVLRRPDSQREFPGTRSATVDYRDAHALGALFRKERPDFVLHVAGSTKGVRYEDFRLANVMPTENLCRGLAAGHPTVERFVLVSSLAAYGPATPDAPLQETSPKRPIEHYGASKRDAEAVLEEGAWPFSWSIIRPGGVYGPQETDYFNLFRLAQRRLNLFFGNRERLQSVVYVDDLVDAICRAATRDEAHRRGYFVSDGAPVTWGRFQGAIQAATGKRALELNLPELVVDLAARWGEFLTRIDGKPRLLNRQKAVMGAQPAWTCSPDAAVNELGFAPRFGLEEGIARTLAWYRQTGWL